MIQKTLLLIVSFYLLTLLQGSFFIPNFVFISVILINLFTAKTNWLGIGSAFIGGFLLDIFSSQFFGWNVIILLVTALFIRLIFKKYVWTPIPQIY